MVSREVWGKHPDELDGLPHADYMKYDFIALALVERSEIK